MSAAVLDSDDTLLNLLRKRGSVEIHELVEALGVTATAVRQRLGRLMDEGLVCREESERRGRGRPRHSYRLTDQGRRTSGNNYADLVDVLWAEIRAIDDPEIRAGLLKRIAMQLGLPSRRAVGRDAGRKNATPGRDDAAEAHSL